jgi:FKBP-type peptidyl-prolyl cis-trans isomerase 2
MTIKKGDFIELDFTGKLSEGNLIFDTTNKEIGKAENFDKTEFEAIKIRVGDNQVIKGLDEDLIGKEINQDYSVKINPENAFGKKSSKLIQLVSISKFKKENIKPMPGLQVQINDQIGIVKTVTGGRVMVDFNHPLSGKEVTYDYKIKKIIEDNIEKIKAFFLTSFGIKELNIKEIEKGYEIETKNQMPNMIKEEFVKKLKEIISNDKEYIFTSSAKTENKNETKE